VSLEAAIMKVFHEGPKLTVFFGIVASCDAAQKAKSTRSPLCGEPLVLT